MVGLMHDFRSIYRPDRTIDISKQAEAQGFAAPVAISRVAYDRAVRAWSACPCSSCEEMAERVERDRIDRLLRAMGNATEGAGDAHEIEFALDIPRRGCCGRELVPLRASLGPNNFTTPVIVVTLHNEIYENPLTSFAPPPEGPA